MQRFVDKNNDIQRSTDVRGVDGSGKPLLRPAQDPILPDVLNIIDVGTPGQSKDKPWVAADVGRRSWNAGKRCELLSWTKNRQDVSNAAETVGAFSVYVTYANFNGQSNKPDIFASASGDCGKTFSKPVKLTHGRLGEPGNEQRDRSAHRRGVRRVAQLRSPDAVMMSKSTDGGASWRKKPITVATIKPYDQGSTSVAMRTLGFPTVAVSVGADGQSRVHVAWSQRSVAPNTTPPYACPGTTIRPSAMRAS